MSEDVVPRSWKKQICLVGVDVIKNKELNQAAHTFELPVVTSETGEEYVDSLSKGIKTIFVVSDFTGPVFERLCQSEQRVFGCTVVLSYAEQKLPLPRTLCPVHNLTLENKIVCFSGYRLKEEISSLNTFVHYMGGKTRKDMSPKINYLIAAVPFGEKYQFAANLGIPIVSKQWLHHLWSLRHQRHIIPDDYLKDFRYKPFTGRKLIFWGFADEVRVQREEAAKTYGGMVLSLGNSSCTHVVVSTEVNPDELADVDFGNNVHIVKDSWFTASIEMNACVEESLYQFWKNDYRTPPHTKGKMSKSTPLARSGLRRKRPRNVLGESSSTLEETTDSAYSSNDRLSSLCDDSLTKYGGDFSPFCLLSPSPVKCKTPHSLSSKGLLPSIREHARSSFRSPSPTIEKLNVKLETMTSRQKVVYELLQTEFNYVGILKMLVNDFMKNAEQLINNDDRKRLTGSAGYLEKEEKKRGIGQTEIKIIFGNLPPILAVHRKLRNQLFRLLESWNENSSVGQVFLDHAEELLRVYPPFVNFFEDTKQMIRHCEAEYPEFQTFLKQCQEHPKSGRQSLIELIIRPVQRLPSIILLLNDILKHTEQNNSDHSALESAVKAIKEVLTHINEDKRKTEGQVAMFDVAREVDGCPATLISSHRKFTTKANVVIVKGEIKGKARGSILTLFLFNDVLEICKARTKATNTPGKTTGTTASSSGQNAKSYKHLELLQLSHIKRVINVTDSETCSNAFGIRFRTHEELKENELIVSLVGDDVNKEKFLKTLSLLIATARSQVDVENILFTADPQSLNIDAKDVVTKAWSTAVRVCSKIGRNLTMRRTTPTKRPITRSMSTFLTPTYEKKEECTENFVTGSLKLRNPQLTPLLGKKAKADVKKD